MADIYLADELRTPPSTPPQSVPAGRANANDRRFRPDVAALRSYEGVYASRELDASFQLRVEEGRLTVHVGRNPAQALVPLTLDEFESPSLGKIRFHRDSAQRVAGFSVFGESIRDVRFARERP